MKARIRNRLDEIVEKMYADASVADQLEFQSWPERSKATARKAIALEIDAAADAASDADSRLGDAVEAVKLQFGELKAELGKLLVMSASGDPGSDFEVARAKVRALLPEIDDAIGELEIAAEAEPE